MTRLMNQDPTELVGFDDAGIFVGSATLIRGGWQVTCRRNMVAEDATREEAESLLLMYGAKVIRDSAGVRL